MTYYSNHNRSTSASNTAPISEPTDGRLDPVKKFCTGKVDIIGQHLGYLLGTYSNKDGSGGLFITDGTSAFHIDSLNNIHIKTGATDADGPGGGQLQLGAERLLANFNEYALEVGPVDDKSSPDKTGTKEEKVSAYTIQVYGNADINCTDGDLKLGGKNILLDAKDVVKITAGTQVQVEAGDGGGKIDMLASELTSNTSSTTFNQTASFRIDGAEEIVFNQKVKFDPTKGNISVATPGASVATNSIGNSSNVLLGSNKITSVGNTQTETYKFLTTSIGGDSQVSVGPVSSATVAQQSIVGVGAPTPTSRETFAVGIVSGGSVGTSFGVTGMDVQLASAGTVTSYATSIIDNIGSVILLN